jgi:hypothetical protein
MARAVEDIRPHEAAGNLPGRMFFDCDSHAEDFLSPEKLQGSRHKQ